MCGATSEAHDRCMDNSYLDYMTAELEYRRELMRRSAGSRRLRDRRSPWRRRHAKDVTTAI